MEVHKACCYGLVVVVHCTSTPIKYEICRVPEAMKKLTESMESLAREIYKNKRKYFTFVGQFEFPGEAADTCWVCEEHFAEESMVVVKHTTLLINF